LLGGIFMGWKIGKKFNNFQGYLVVRLYLRQAAAR